MYMILYNTSVCSFSANPFNVKIESILFLCIFELWNIFQNIMSLRLVRKGILRLRTEGITHAHV